MVSRIPIFALLAAAMTFAAVGENITLNASVDSHLESVTLKAKRSVGGSQTLGPLNRSWSGQLESWEVGIAYTATVSNVDAGYTARWKVSTNGVEALSGNMSNTITLPTAAFSGCALSFYGEPITSSVTLDRQSGSGGSSSVTATYDAAMPTATMPTRTGYIFGGYYTAANGGGTQYYTAAGASARNWDKTSATTLYAQWTAIKNVVSFDRQSGSGGSSSVTATYDAAMPAATMPTRAGYIFGGYYTAKSGAGTQYYTAAGASARSWDRVVNTVLYAKWTAITSTVTLDRQSGDGGSSSVTATYDAAMPTATMPTRAGYIFGGYYTAVNGGGTQYYTAAGASAKKWDKTSATTLYAKWTAIKSAVSFDRQSGSGGSSSVTATYDAAMPTATMPTRTGYIFGGYYTATNGVGTQYYTAAGASARSWDRTVNTVLYAKWTGFKSAVSFDRQSGGGGSSSVTAIYGDAMPTAAMPTREGYIFGGYYSEKNGGGTQYYTAAGASARSWDRTVNTVLYAKWTAIKSAVSFDRQSGGGGSGSVTATYGEAMPTAAMPTREGYIFGGYFSEKNGGGTQYYTAAGASARSWDRTVNTVLYAKWTGIKSAVSFDRQSGSGGSGSVTATYGEAMPAAAMPAAAMPTRAGYIFDGYYTAANGGGTQYYTAAGASARSWDRTVNTVLYAKWKQNPIVTFELNGGTFQNGWMTPTNYVEGVGMYLPTAADITYTNRAFIGWYEDEMCLGDRVTRIDPSDRGDKIFYARWEGRTYKVSFDVNGGGGRDHQEQSLSMTNSERLKTLADLYITPQDGYTFAEWNTAVDGSGDSYSDGAVIENNLTNVANTTVTLYAQWTPNPYEAVFQPNGADGGETMDRLLCTYDVPTNLPVCGFTYTGYAFECWSSDTNHTYDTKYYLDGAVVTNLATGGVVNLYANWTGIVYTVSFDANGGAGAMDPMVCTYGVPTNLPSCTFTCGSWEFQGWTTNECTANGEADVQYGNGARVTNVTATAEVTLRACWKGPVTLDARDPRGDGVITNAGEAVSVQTNFIGETWVLPDATNANPHLVFDKWRYVDAQGVTKDLPARVQPDTTNLVVQWEWVPDALAIAVDATNLEFTTFATKGPYGNVGEAAYPTNWIVETDFVCENAEHVSTNAVQGGGFPEQQTDGNVYMSWLMTKVPGRVILSFCWKCAAKSRVLDSGIWYGDSLVFGPLFDQTNITVVAELTNVVDWCSVAYTNESDEAVSVAWAFKFRSSEYFTNGGGAGWVDCVTWTPLESPTGDVTPKHKVPYSWLREKFPDSASATGAALEELAESQSPGESLPPGKTWPNGEPVKVWQDYWAGTDPNDPNDLFRANIVVSNDVPDVSWQPDLSTGTPARVYKVLCAPTPSAQEWVVWPGPGDSGASTNRFFKVEIILEEE